MNSMPSIKAIDFFCGAGGFTRGLLDAGIDVRVGIDWDQDLRETYEKNNHPAKFISANIRDLQIHRVRELIAGDEQDEGDLLLVAGAPCQPFTKFRRKGRRREEATLPEAFARFIQELAPRFVLFENVPGIAKVPGFSSYRRMLRSLRDAGYEYHEGVLDAKDFGVPQTRRRLICIAGRDIQPGLPPRTHGPGLQPHRSVRDAIRTYPPVEAGEADPTIPNHSASALSAKNLERIRQTPHDGGDRRAWPSHLWLECHKNGHSGHTDVYGRMRWDQPAPALTCRCDSLSNGRFGHPEQDRAITLREASKLQGFADDYVFYGPSRDHLAAQIGNAVPVTLAKTLGNHLLQYASHRQS